MEGRGRGLSSNVEKLRAEGKRSFQAVSKMGRVSTGAVSCRTFALTPHEVLASQQTTPQSAKCWNHDIIVVNILQQYRASQPQTTYTPVCHADRLIIVVTVHDAALIPRATHTS